jgi:hypothetical protein
MRVTVVSDPDSGERRLSHASPNVREPEWHTMAVVPTNKETTVAIAYVQEFKIADGDKTTSNYDAVVAALNLQDSPDGLLIHTAGFDHDAGVFRIFDVWETREQGDKFINERLNPIIEPMAAAAAQNPDSDFAPPSRETWYELHDSMTG